MRAFELTFRGAERRSCRLRIGSRALGALAEELAAEPAGRPLVIVTDSNVGPLWGQRVEGDLAARGLAVSRLEFPAGEASKTRETKARLEDALLDLGAGRETAIVAVGGGVTGDLAGFLAATWHRGVPVVQVPTTLLAMADAAIGGKTAVDLPGGKNLIGCFHQPWGVYADPATLATLPDAVYREGLPEVVKTAAIGDAELFEWLERSVDALLRREAAALEHALLAAVHVKTQLVEADERDTGRRAALNFGHTVAHALEAATGYTVSHGAAVSVGLCVEARLAVEVTGLPAGDAGRISALLAACGLPVRLPAGLERNAVLDATRRDKKTRGGCARFALPAGLGRMPPGPEGLSEVDAEWVRRVLDAFGEPRGPN